MEIRYFQIIVPLFVLILLIKQIRAFLKSKSNIYETVLIIIFWLSVLVFTFFPLFFSELIANIFGIEDSNDAIIFFALGLVFYFQLQFYKMIRKQDETLTELARKIALGNPEKRENLTNIF